MLKKIRAFLTPWIGIPEWIYIDFDKGGYPSFRSELKNWRFWLTIGIVAFIFWLASF